MIENGRALDRRLIIPDHICPPDDSGHVYTKGDVSGKGKGCASSSRRGALATMARNPISLPRNLAFQKAKWKIRKKFRRAESETETSLTFW